MAQYRTSPAQRAHRELVALKALGGVTLAMLAYAGLTGGANAPGFATAALAAAEPQATLTRTGEDIMITGSIDHMFSTGSFAGPNRAEKTDRARPTIDVVAVSHSFDDIRARIAALRQPKMPAIISPVEVAAIAPPAADVARPIDVASLTAPLENSALTAIEAVSLPDTGIPVPRTMSTKLAYARADLPATVFDGSVADKSGKKVSQKDVWCMATAIYFEARGESYRGQVAVGQVVMNRVAHRLYPSTICGVVFQNQNKRNACQFSFACDGIPERVSDEKSWKQAMTIAKDVISGTDYLPEVGHATHYHATYVYPHWAPRMKKVTKIGMHVFYQFKRGWQFG